VVVSWWWWWWWRRWWRWCGGGVVFVCACARGGAYSHLLMPTPHTLCCGNVPLYPRRCVQCPTWSPTQMHPLCRCSHMACLELCSFEPQKPFHRCTLAVAKSRSCVCLFSSHSHCHLFSKSTRFFPSTLSVSLRRVNQTLRVSSCLVCIHEDGTQKDKRNRLFLDVLRLAFAAHVSCQKPARLPALQPARPGATPCHVMAWHVAIDPVQSEVSSGGGDHVASWPFATPCFRGTVM